MNNRIFVFKAICITFLFTHFSCKKDLLSETILYPKMDVKIDSAYQKNVAINDDEKSEVKSIIDFSSKYNSSKLWRYKTELKKSGLASFNVLANGNLVSIITNIENENNIVPFILVLNKNGKELYRHNIGDGVSTYNFRESWIADNYDDGFTIYVRKGVNVEGKNAAKSNRKNQNVKYEIEKMTFRAKGSEYISESISIRDVLLRQITDSGFNLEDNSFSIYYLKGKIFVDGTVKKNNKKEFPFVAILDKDFKLMNFNVFKDYENTLITNITFYSDNDYYINGVKGKETDLYRKWTLQRFIVNKDLKVIEDHSDKRTPYYDRVYREPTPLEEKILEKEFEDIDETENKYNTDYNTRGNSNTVLDPNIFYWDSDENCYYSKKSIELRPDEMMFIKNVNEVDLWQIKIKFPKNYKNNWTSDNTIGLKRANGDFIVSMVIEKLSSKYLFSTVIFVFNKQGKIVRQFEVLGASKLTEVKESAGKLIINYIRDDGFFVNNKWEEHYAFYSECYPLD